MTWKSCFYNIACKKFYFNYYQKISIYVESLIGDLHDAEEITYQTLLQICIDDDLHRKETLLASVWQIATDKCFEKDPSLKACYEHDLADNTRLKEKFNDALVLEEMLRGWNQLSPEQQKEKIQECIELKDSVTHYQSLSLLNRQPVLSRSHSKHFATQCEIISMLQNYAKIYPANRWVSFQKQLDSARQQERYKKQPDTDRQPKRYYVRLMAAAAVIAFGLVITFNTFNHRSRPVTTVIPTLSEQNLSTGTEPELILCNGSIIKLDSVPDGAFIAPGLPFKKEGSKLVCVYREPDDQVLDKSINILSIPPARTYQVTLADGSVIDLNAGSQLHFPVNFSTSERWVSVNGEAYFKVKANPEKPFFVKLKDQVTVKVTGTSFNIHAYSETDYIKTSLFEGRLQIISNSGKNSKLLQPGQEAIIKKSHFVINDILKIDQITAWREHKFNFDDKSVQEIMEEIGRWYNVKVKYVGKIPVGTFDVRQYRSATLKDIIKYMSSSGAMRIIQLNDTLIVSSEH